MQYEIYLDKLFFMNMFFNCTILFATKKILRLKSGKSIVYFAGMIGSMGLCSVFLLPFQHAITRVIYLLCFVFPVMICIAFYGNPWRKHIQAGIVVFGVALMSGKLVESVYSWGCRYFAGSKYIGILLVGFAGIYLIYGFGKIYLGLCEEEKKILYCTDKIS